MYIRFSQATQKKGYVPGWTEEVFIIQWVDLGNPESYIVTEFDGTFYKEELQRVKVGNDTLWRIEKVLKRRGNRLCVQWKGWPSKYNS